MPETTPRKIGQDVDDVLNRLNAEWDLQLPRLHGRAAHAAENTSALAKRCSARIRYLFFRLKPADIAKILDEVSQRAYETWSGWTLKPKQEQGTIPVRSAAESYLKRDVKRNRAFGLLRPTEKQRRGLLDLLNTTLEDEYELARASDSYSRTPGVDLNGVPSTSGRISRRHVHISGAASTFKNDNSPQPIFSAARRQKSASNQFSASQVNLTSNPRGSGRKYLAREGVKVQASQAPATPDPATSEKNSLRQSSESRPADSQSQMGKKRKSNTAHDEGDHPNKAARQGPMYQFLRRSLPEPVLSATPSRPTPISFDSTGTPSPPAIFDAENSRTSSANTSVLEQDKDESQDYFPTQDATEYLQDDQITTSLNLVDPVSSSIPKTFEERLDPVLDFQRNRFPSRLSFACLYEIQSLSLSWSLDALVVFKELERRCQGQIEDAAARWDAIKAVSKQLGPHRLYGTSAWSPNSAQTQMHAQRKSTYLTGSLSWAESSREDLFRLQLNGPVADRSCRFHRKYGGSRFLVLNVPYTREYDIPKTLRPRAGDVEKIQTAINQWLSTRRLSIAGRTYRPFWVEPGESKGRYFSKVHLFATSGEGLKPSCNDPLLCAISIEDFINWHTPILDNLGSTDLKLFARMKLGLSKTIPTVVLSPTEIIEVRDSIGSDVVTVMNDGCSRISRALADEIASMLDMRDTPSFLGCQGRMDRGLEGRPTVFG